MRERERKRVVLYPYLVISSFDNSFIFSISGGEDTGSIVMSPLDIMTGSLLNSEITWVDQSWDCFCNVKLN